LRYLLTNFMKIGKLVRNLLVGHTHSQGT